jgi:glycosyltransferase involved in cell wall biosynthesis
LFKTINKAEARKQFNLPLNKKIIAFGSMNINDSNKGGKELEAIIHIISERYSEVEIITIGSGAKPAQWSNLNVHNLGHLENEIEIAKFYSASDLFILPSKQDNLPNMIMEAMACSTPSVGFDIGGVPDMIEHQHNGYLAKAFDCEDFAQGIQWLLDNPEYDKICHNARKTVEDKFDIKKVVSQYTKLYKEILDQN